MVIRSEIEEKKIRHTDIVTQFVDAGHYDLLINVNKFYMQYIKNTSIVKKLFENCTNSSTIIDFIDKVNDLNVTCQDGKRIVHHAIEKLDLKIIKHLISKGVDMKCKTRDGNTVLHTLVRMLDSHKNSPDKIVNATNIIKFLLTKKLFNRIDIYDANGLTPFHYLAKYNRVDIGILFVREGANINKKINNSVNGITPIQIAISSNSFEFVQFLLTNNCEVRDLDVKLAKKENHREIAKLILQYQLYKI